MGDSETVVAGLATVNDYTPTDYNPVTDDSKSGVLMEGVYSVPEGTTTTYDRDTNTVMQDAPVVVEATYADTTGVAVDEAGGQESVAVELAVVVGGYDASVNGNGVDESSTAAGHVENGNVENDVSGDLAEQQIEEVTSEEGRLWSAVKANPLDFNSWTALIEETERVAEDNILKIRKIYDTFLAEFPLCYGYWKKYAEHEARLGYIEKVVEVFERGVEAVTYSVDMWLHYCIFAISTYGDPDKVRSMVLDMFGGNVWHVHVEIVFDVQNSGFQVSISNFIFLKKFNYVAYTCFPPTKASLVIVLFELLPSLIMRLRKSLGARVSVPCGCGDHVQLRVKVARVSAPFDRHSNVIFRKAL